MKRSFAIIRCETVNGERAVTYEADFWEGGSTADEAGRYERRRFTVRASQLRNHCAPSVSFYAELKTALGV